MQEQWLSQEAQAQEKLLASEPAQRFEQVRLMAPVLSVAQVYQLEKL